MRTITVVCKGIDSEKGEYEFTREEFHPEDVQKKTELENRMDEILKELAYYDPYSIKYAGQNQLGIISDEDLADWMNIESTKQDLRNEYNTKEIELDALMELV